MSDPLITRKLTDADDAAWHALLAASPAGTSFLRRDWLDQLAATDSYGTRFHRVGCFDEKGALRGGWALPYRSHAGFHYSTYFEFFYAGPVLAPELETGSVHHASERTRVLQALALAQSNQLHIIEAETHPAVRDIRPLLYAGWTAVPLYTHLWDLADPDHVLASMNREKRRVIKLARERYRFEFTTSAADREGFLALYRQLVTKFDWVPLPRWDHDLRQRMEWLAACDGGRLFTATAKDGTLRAAVLALLSREDRTAYLWRCAYQPDPESNTIIPALYWQCALALREEWGAPLHINFGGSPRPSLAQFKDYLGATPTLNFRLVHDQPGPRTRWWRQARKVKETGRRVLTKGGLLQAWYRAQQSAAPETTPEERP